MQMPSRSDKNKSRRQEDSDSKALAVPGFGFPRLFEDFMTPFDELMGRFFTGSMRSGLIELGRREPAIDLQDRGDHYLVTAELPGFERKNVEAKVSSNVLELKAERSTEEERKSEDAAETKRTHSYFQKSFALPAEVLSEKVSGTMKNGVLELKLPKKERSSREESRRVDLK
jgi:HSP20 family protein